ncbi:hypothetical protein ACA910_002287 [Epithemia clementina (nom. ined.)]
MVQRPGGGVHRASSMAAAPVGRSTPSSNRRRQSRVHTPPRHIIPYDGGDDGRESPVILTKGRGGGKKSSPMVIPYRPSNSHSNNNNNNNNSSRDRKKRTESPVNYYNGRESPYATTTTTNRVGRDMSLERRDSPAREERRQPPPERSHSSRNRTMEYSSTREAPARRESPQQPPSRRKSPPPSSSSSRRVGDASTAGQSSRKSSTVAGGPSVRKGRETPASEALSSLSSSLRRPQQQDREPYNRKGRESPAPEVLSSSSPSPRRQQQGREGNARNKGRESPAPEARSLRRQERGRDTEYDYEYHAETKATARMADPPSRRQETLSGVRTKPHARPSPPPSRRGPPVREPSIATRSSSGRTERESFLPSVKAREFVDHDGGRREEVEDYAASSGRRSHSPGKQQRESRNPSIAPRSSERTERELSLSPVKAREFVDHDSGRREVEGHAAPSGERYHSPGKPRESISTSRRPRDDSSNRRYPQSTTTRESSIGPPIEHISRESPGGARRRADDGSIRQDSSDRAKDLPPWREGDGSSRYFSGRTKSPPPSSRLDEGSLSRYSPSRTQPPNSSSRREEGSLSRDSTSRKQPPQSSSRRDESSLSRDSPSRTQPPPSSSRRDEASLRQDSPSRTQPPPSSSRRDEASLRQDSPSRTQPRPSSSRRDEASLSRNSPSRKESQNSSLRREVSSSRYLNPQPQRGSASASQRKSPAKQRESPNRLYESQEKEAPVRTSDPKYRTELPSNSTKFGMWEEAPPPPRGSPQRIDAPFHGSIVHEQQKRKERPSSRGQTRESPIVVPADAPVRRRNESPTKQFLEDTTPANRRSGSFRLKPFLSGKQKRRGRSDSPVVLTRNNRTRGARQEGSSSPKTKSIRQLDIEDLPSSPPPAIQTARSSSFNILQPSSAAPLRDQSVSPPRSRNTGRSSIATLSQDQTLHSQEKTHAYQQEKRRSYSPKGKSAEMLTSMREQSESPVETRAIYRSSRSRSRSYSPAKSQLRSSAAENARNSRSVSPARSSTQLSPDAEASPSLKTRNVASSPPSKYQRPHARENFNERQSIRTELSNSRDSPSTTSRDRTSSPEPRGKSSLTEVSSFRSQPKPMPTSQLETKKHTVPSDSSEIRQDSTKRMNVPISSGNRGNTTPQVEKERLQSEAHSGRGRSIALTHSRTQLNSTPRNLSRSQKVEQRRSTSPPKRSTKRSDSPVLAAPPLKQNSSQGKASLSGLVIELPFTFSTEERTLKINSGVTTEQNHTIPATAHEADATELKDNREPPQEATKSGPENNMKKILKTPEDMVLEYSTTEQQYPEVTVVHSKNKSGQHKREEQEEIEELHSVEINLTPQPNRKGAKPMEMVTILIPTGDIPQKEQNVKREVKDKIMNSTKGFQEIHGNNTKTSKKITERQASSRKPGLQETYERATRIIKGPLETSERENGNSKWLQRSNEKSKRQDAVNPSQPTSKMKPRKASNDRDHNISEPVGDNTKSQTKAIISNDQAVSVDRPDKNTSTSEGSAKQQVSEDKKTPKEQDNSDEKLDLTADGESLDVSQDAGEDRKEDGYLFFSFVSCYLAMSQIGKKLDTMMGFKGIDSSTTDQETMEREEERAGSPPLSPLAKEIKSILKVSSIDTKDPAKKTESKKELKYPATDSTEDELDYGAKTCSISWGQTPSKYDDEVKDSDKETSSIKATQPDTQPESNTDSAQISAVVVNILETFDRRFLSSGTTIKRANRDTTGRGESGAFRHTNEGVNASSSPAQPPPCPEKCSTSEACACGDLDNLVHAQGPKVDVSDNNEKQRNKAKKDANEALAKQVVDYLDRRANLDETKTEINIQKITNPNSKHASKQKSNIEDIDEDSSEGNSNASAFSSNESKDQKPEGKDTADQHSTQNDMAAGQSQQQQEQQQSAGANAQALENNTNDKQGSKDQVRPRTARVGGGKTTKQPSKSVPVKKANDAVVVVTKTNAVPSKSTIRTQQSTAANSNKKQEAAKKSIFSWPVRKQRNADSKKGKN